MVKAMSLKKAMQVARKNVRSRRAAPRKNFAFTAPGRAVPELKTIDTTISPFAVSTTANITLINGVAQGTDDTNRVGRRFQMKSVQIRASIYGGSAQTTTAPSRMMVVHDKQANGAAPVITDILASAQTTALFNLDNRDRFTILWDKVYPVGVPNYFAPTPAATNFNGFNLGEITLYRKLSLLVTNAGTGATVASINSGALYFVCVGNTGTGTGVPQMNASARVRFLDA